jgi:DNA polymerase-3 subunit delta
LAASEWTYNRLSQSLKKGEFGSLYCFFGEETFLAERAYQEVVDSLVPEGMRDFNLSIFDAADCDIARVRDAIETLPMMSPHRLIVLQNAHHLKDREWEVLQPFLDRPLDGSVLVCLASKIDKRKRYWKRLLDTGIALECKRPYDNQIPEWIEFLANRHGVKFGVDAAAALQQVVGSNLSDLDGEIRKIAIFCGGQHSKSASSVGRLVDNKVGEKKVIEVSVDDVMKVASRVRLETVFDFADAVGRNDRARALYCLANLLDQGQNEIGIIALVARHVRILRSTIEGLREGLSGQKLAAKAGISPFFVRDYAEQARLWSMSKIDHTLEALYDTDKALKTSPIVSHIWLENFIVRVCG